MCVCVCVCVSGWGKGGSFMNECVCVCVGRGGDDLYSSLWPVAGLYHQISTCNILIESRKVFS